MSPDDLEQIQLLLRRFLATITEGMSQFLKSFDREPTPIPAASQISRPPVKLRAVEKAILESASDKPLTIRALARRAGYKFNSYFRQAIADLIAAQRIERRGDGYTRCP